MSRQASDIEDSSSCNKYLCPFVYNYGPVHVRDLQPGKLYLFCTCGLSTNQPWCDQSHRGTNFKPLQWRCPTSPQTIYAMCGCKYSQSLPYCDGSHIDLPLKVKQQQKECPLKHQHSSVEKLCSTCGWLKE